MKISCIIPIYNVEAYLIKCVDSVVKQTHNNVEIILVNDGSTDRSGDNVDDLARSDNRIKVIHKANEGLSSARNAGLEIATGDFLCFVDADDTIEPNMFADLLKIALDHNVDLVQGGLTKVDLEGRAQDNQIRTTLSIVSRNNALEYFFIGKLLSTIIVDKLYSKRIFTHLRFPHGQTMEDAFLLSEIYAEVKTDIVVSDKSYYNYLIRQGSIMNQKFKINHMVSSFSAYKNRMRVAKICNRMDLFNLAAQQLASDILQYYRLIYLNKIDGDKQKFYSIIKKEYLENQQLFRLSLIKVELMILYFFPTFVGTILQIHKLKSWASIAR